MGYAGQSGVSIAKAIPSLLELTAQQRVKLHAVGFNRESDSVTVGAMGRSECRVPQTKFQSRKRFRHCWSRASRSMVRHTSLCFNRESDSVTVGASRPRPPAASHRVSIAKAIPSLLERSVSRSSDVQFDVSIAKAIPSLLERHDARRCTTGCRVSIAKAIPSLLELRKAIDGHA